MFVSQHLSEEKSEYKNPFLKMKTLNSGKKVKKQKEREILKMENKLFTQKDFIQDSLFTNEEIFKRETEIKEAEVELGENSEDLKEMQLELPK